MQRRRATLLATGAGLLLAGCHPHAHQDATPAATQTLDAVAFNVRASRSTVLILPEGAAIGIAPRTVARDSLLRLELASGVLAMRPLSGYRPLALSLRIDVAGIDRHEPTARADAHLPSSRTLAIAVPEEFFPRDLANAEAVVHLESAGGKPIGDAFLRSNGERRQAEFSLSLPSTAIISATIWIRKPEARDSDFGFTFLRRA